MLTIIQSSGFKKDLKLAQKRGKDLSKLKTLPGLLVNQTPLSSHYRDHPLKSNWNGFRDAHIEPDWLLIYRMEGDELQLARTGGHSDLFKK